MVGGTQKNIDKKYTTEKIAIIKKLTNSYLKLYWK